jgi:hypothetical protein
MANKILWAAESAVTLLGTELNNAADTTLIVDGADYNNGTNKYRWADFLLFLDDFDAAPDSGAYVELHIFYKLDGEHYADGEEGDAATPDATGNSLHGVFLIQAKDADQYQQVLGVPLRPFAFRAAVELHLGQDLAAVDTHFLKMYPYNEELQ